MHYFGLNEIYRWKIVLYSESGCKRIIRTKWTTGGVINQEVKKMYKKMVEEGTLCKEMLKDLVVIDNIYQISKIC